MRLKGIHTYEQANAYLPVFIKEYNAKFAVRPISDLDFHRKLNPELDLDFLFAIHDFRIISQTLQIQYHNKTYQIITNYPPYFYTKQEVLVTVDSAGTVNAWHHGSKLELKMIEKRPKQGVIVSTQSMTTEPVPPAYNHPWRTYGKKINGKPIFSTLPTQ